MMEASVRYVQFANSSAKLGICLRGTKTAHCVMNYDSGISVLDVENREFDKMRVVPNVDVEKAARQFISYTTRRVARKEITKGAAELLGRILNEQVVVAEPTPEPDANEAPTSPKPSPSGRSNVLADICAELKIEPTVARRRLRAAGLSAPYDDAAKIRKVLA